MNTALASTTAQFALLPFDWVVAAFVLVVISFDAFRSGTARAAAVVIASTTTLSLLALLPHTFVIGKMVGEVSSPLTHAIIEDGIWIIAWILSYRMMSGREYPQGALIALFAGAAAVASMLVVWVHSQALQSIWQSSASMQSIFGAGYALWWLVGAYIILAIARS